MSTTGRLGVGVLAWLIGAAVWGQEPAGKPKLQEPPAETVAAWTKAGGRYGGMKANVIGVLGFFPHAHPPAGEYPTFQFSKDPGQRFVDLPAVEVPFGLHLTAKWVTDAVVKDLAG